MASAKKLPSANIKSISDVIKDPRFEPMFKLAIQSFLAHHATSESVFAIPGATTEDKVDQMYKVWKSASLSKQLMTAQLERSYEDGFVNALQRVLDDNDDNAENDEDYYTLYDLLVAVRHEAVSRLTAADKKLDELTVKM